jgi:ABC-type dipeptide/oligopeptide/nickel transport system permease subunit
MSETPSQPPLIAGEEAVLASVMPRRGSRLSAAVRRPSAIISIVVLVAIMLVSLIVPQIFSWRTPSGGLFEPPSAHHWLGTDDSGYDILARIAVGGRVSLGVAFGVEALIVVVGSTVGLLAGYYGGAADTVLMRFTDMMFAFPDILLAILVAAMLQGGLSNVVVALAVSGWPGMARLVRGQTLSLRNREFVDAARAIGVPTSQILLRHIYPNLLHTVIVAATVDIAGLVVAESTLSFLGIGVQPPLTSWGYLISSAKQYFVAGGHSELTFYPALFLMLTVLAINFLGDALRDARR